MDRVGRRTTLPPERMTPIKIRGRRGQKARLRAQQKTKEAADAADMASSTIIETTAEVQRSKLESLPTEIIESIFLYSMNVELPRASLMLGRVLSSTGIKHRVLRAILLNPYLEGAFDDETSGNLQSTLLRCRWVDRAMFTHALHELWLAELVALFQNPSPIFSNDVSETPQHVSLLGPECPIADTSTSTIAQFVKSFEPQTRLLENRQWEWVSYSGVKFTLIIDDWSGKIWFERTASDPCDFPRGSIYQFRLANACNIPTKVLHGPWTESKLWFLRVLLSCNATLEWETNNNGKQLSELLSYSFGLPSHSNYWTYSQDNPIVAILTSNLSLGEVAELSLCEAIVQGNTALLEILLSERPMPPYFPVIPLTQKHIRLAIFEGGCNTKTIKLLLEQSRYLNSVNECPRGDIDLRLDDDDILEWATAKAEVGDDRGHWLLRIIKGWEQFGDRSFRHVGPMIAER
ncbi:MAG: hypothetical protein Q9204_007321 [Flavoplaca sp. TL-2023a]